jgi:hypothetical protein
MVMVMVMVMVMGRGLSSGLDGDVQWEVEVAGDSAVGQMVTWSGRWK